MATNPYILVAPNGARRGPEDHAKLPVTLDQTISTARACHLAGADGLHLHIRDADGRHSLDAARYLEAVAELNRQLPKLDVQITTEAAGLYDVEAQFECLRRVQPKWASISVREIARHPDLAERVYGLCHDQGTRVQHILYDAEDAALLNEWQNAGVVRDGQADRLLVLGRYTVNQISSPEDITSFPQDTSPWMVCAFGPLEHACLAEAARQGGDLRVGFENSLTNSDGQPWPDNAASVTGLMALLKGASQ